MCDIVNFSRFALTTVEGLTIEKSFCRSPYGFSTVFKSGGHIPESTGREISLAPQDALELRRCELPRGIWGHAPPGNFKNRPLRNAVSSVSRTQESLSQGKAGVHSNPL